MTSTEVGRPVSVNGKILYLLFGIFLFYMNMYFAQSYLINSKHIHYLNILKQVRYYSMYEYFKVE